MAKERSFKQTLILLNKNFDAQRKLFLFGLFFGLLDALCQSILPLFFRFVLNKFEVGISDYYSEIFVPCSIAAASLIILFFPSAYLYHLFCTIATADFLKNLRIRLFTHVQSLSLDFFSRNKVGEITSRLSGDINAIEMGLQRIMGLTWTLCVFVQCIIYIYFINFHLSLLVSVLLLGITIPSKLFLPKIRSLNRDVREATGEASAVMTEYIAINPLIKSFAREDYGIDKIKVVSQEVFLKTKKVLLSQFTYSDVMQVFVRFLSPILILLLGGYLISIKKLMLGDMVAFWGYWMILSGLINTILDSLTGLFQSFSAADRIFDYLEEPLTVKDKENAIDLTFSNGEIQFENVHFQYPHTQEDVIKKFNLKISAGRQIALVGPSGGGKSTILQLILRFYDPTQGRILINGKDIRDYTQKSLRNHLGFVMQESVFFAGTIKENLLLSKPNATDDEITVALKNANALEFVSEFPEKTETILGERGARLSGGQKQRLAIARVFLKNPPILIFDEATSALDSLSEKSVQEALSRLINNRTTITVAHRLSTIQNADEIFVLKQGEIIASGTHAELLKSSDIYKNLAVHQGLG